jgi:HAE1 family hydrophobic/amphiphilic exporter-1
MLVSFTLTPMMSSRWLKAHVDGAKSVGERIVDWVYRPIERVYGGVLRFVMRHRWIVVSMSLVTLGSCIPLAGATPKGFLPVNDDGRFQVQVRAPEGTSLEQTGLIGERIARAIHQDPHVKLTIMTIGEDNAQTRNLATIYVGLTDPLTRETTQNQMMDWVRHEIIAKQDKSLRITASEVSPFAGGGFSTQRNQYTVRGTDLSTLEKIASEVAGKLKAVPGAVDVDTSLITGKPEIGVFIDRARAADLGVQPADIANALRLLVEGDRVSNYEEHGEEYEVHVRAQRQYRADEEGLRLLTVPSSRLGYVALADVVQLRQGTGPSRVDRLNRERDVLVMANAAPGFSDGAISAAMGKILDGMHLPVGYTASPYGQTREMGRVFKAFVASLLLSFIFMYLVLAAQFESWLHPITILLTLPLTLPFAFISVILFKQALDIYSILGILVLFGVVKKNAILQIDHTNQLVAKGMPRLDAILQANRDRLRPILMTTAAFVAGMIPLVMSRGIGAGFNRATAGVVVGGQILSLSLTLLATPVAYSLFDDASKVLGRLFGRRKAKVGQEISEAQPVAGE